MTAHRVLLLLASSLVVLCATPALAAPAPLRHIALVVGADDPPPGRAPLRFAYDDARQLADALTRVGRFAPGDVHVLLDPTPTALMDAVDAIARTIAAVQGRALFLFYYSGHSDGQMLYPHGDPIRLSDVRDRIERVGARIRVGILDTCRGGSWTQAKGLSVGPPLDVADLWNVTTEGTALVSSSSGVEDAHEAATVHGSFFTHYFTAGLLGAADRSGDGRVTLEEAFDYAKARTVRDSARLAKEPQHPSFDLELRGRQDIVLSTLSASTSALEVSAARAPVEIIQVDSGVTVAEAPPGGPVRVAVPPGRYLVRSVVDGTVYTKEVDVTPGQTVSVAGGQLEATGTAQLAVKGADGEVPPLDLASTPPRHTAQLQLAVGVTDQPQVGGALQVGGNGQRDGGAFTRQLAGTFDATFGITDRLVWGVPVPAFAYRFGRAGGVELIAQGGLTSIGYSAVAGIVGTASAALQLRVWTAPNESLLTTAGGSDSFQGASAGSVWDSYASVGYGWTLGNLVTLRMAAGVHTFWPTGSGQRAAFVELGAIQDLAFRRLPLVEVHVSRRFSLDLFASWALGVQHPSNGGLVGPSTQAMFEDTYMAGFTWTF